MQTAFIEKFKLKCRQVILTLVCILLLLLTNVLFARAIEYGGIGGRPAYPRPDNPRTDSIFVHNVEAGQIIEEGVRAINNTQEIKTLLIYAADSTPSSGGGFACKQLLEEQKGVGTWIALKSPIKIEETTAEGWETIEVINQ